MWRHRLRVGKRSRLVLSHLPGQGVRRNERKCKKEGGTQLSARARRDRQPEVAHGKEERLEGKRLDGGKAGR